jgi:hypothetical protein
MGRDDVGGDGNVRDVDCSFRVLKGFSREPSWAILSAFSWELLSAFSLELLSAFSWELVSALL